MVTVPDIVQVPEVLDQHLPATAVPVSCPLQLTGFWHGNLQPAGFFSCAKTQQQGAVNGGGS
jgi:hypothetical protein